MRIAILSRNRSLYSTKRLTHAARRRGHEVYVIDTLHVARQMGLLPRSSNSRAPRRMPKVDAIIPRIGASITPQGVAVVRTFEVHGILTTASSEAIAQSRNKLESWQLMAEANLPHPRTALVSDPDELQSAIHQVSGPPAVLKILRGTQGRGVILAENVPIARTVLSILFRHGQDQVLVQEFIAEAEGKDKRLLIVGGRCVAAMERVAPENDFRANLHRGGTSRAITPDEQTEALAVRAADLHGLGVAGVDVIPSKRGPLLLEANSSPGLEGIEGVTQVDVAREIVQYLERKGQRAGKLRNKRR